MGDKVTNDLRRNRRLPTIGQKIKIPGIDFLVEVTQLTKSSSVIDGKKNL